VNKYLFFLLIQLSISLSITNGYTLEYGKPFYEPHINFGYSVSISNDYAVVGATNVHETPGYAFVYNIKESSKAPIMLTAGIAGDSFGNSVAIHGDFLAIGANRTINNTDQYYYSTGCVYVYYRSGSSWVLHSEIKNISLDDFVFGSNVCFSNHSLIISDSKNIYVYRLISDEWKKIYTFSDYKLAPYNKNLKLKNTDYIITFNRHYNNDFSNIEIYELIGNNLDMLNKIELLTLNNILGANSLFVYKAYLLINHYSSADMTISLRNLLPEKFQSVTKDKITGYSAAMNNQFIVSVDGTPSHPGNTVYFYKKDNNNRYVYITKKEIPSRSVDMSEKYAIVGARDSVYIFDSQQMSLQDIEISGLITDQMGNPIPNIEVSFSGCNQVTAVTDTKGHYTFKTGRGCSVIITPDSNNSSFNPPSISLDDLSNNHQNQNFIDLRELHTISGLIDDINNNPISGVKVSISGSNSITQLFTDNSGLYSFTTALVECIEIEPSMETVSFNPVKRTFCEQNADSFNQQNFSSLSEFKLSLSGQIVTDTISADITIQDIKIEFTNVPIHVYPDASGFFKADIDYNWSGTITPTLPGYIFIPKFRTYSDIINSYQDQNFECLPDESYISDIIVSAETIQLSSNSGFVEISVFTSNTRPQFQWFTVQNSVSWIKTFTTNNKLLIQFSENKSGQERETTINIVAKNLEKAIIIKQFSYQSGMPDWDVKINDYQYQCMMTAIIKNEIPNHINLTNSILGAFVGDECRGSASSLQVSDRTLFFLQIWSNKNNEIITFKYFDRASEKIYDQITPDVKFIPEMELGNIASPYTLTIHKPKHIPDANDDGKVDVIDAIDVLQFLIDVE